MLLLVGCPITGPSTLTSPARWQHFKYDVRRSIASHRWHCAGDGVGLVNRARWALRVAFADPCPDAEVVFARGTGEPAGVGGTGQAFIDSLTAQVSGRSVSVYPVNYPATDDYINSAKAGAADAVPTSRAWLPTARRPRWCLADIPKARRVMDLTTNDMPAPQSVVMLPPSPFRQSASSSYAKQLGGRPDPADQPGLSARRPSICLPNDMSAPRAEA